MPRQRRPSTTRSALVDNWDELHEIFKDMPTTIRDAETFKKWFLDGCDERESEWLRSLGDLLDAIESHDTVQLRVNRALTHLARLRFRDDADDVDLRPAMNILAGLDQDVVDSKEGLLIQYRFNRAREMRATYSRYKKIVQGWDSVTDHLTDECHGPMMSWNERLRHTMRGNKTFADNGNKLIQGVEQSLKIMGFVYVELGIKPTNGLPGIVTQTFC